MRKNPTAWRFGAAISPNIIYTGGVAHEEAPVLGIGRASVYRLLGKGSDVSANGGGGADQA